VVGGYFTRPQGIVARACTLIAVAVHAWAAIGSVFRVLDSPSFGLITMAVAGLGAWAYAANLQASIGSSLRTIAMLVQILVLLQSLSGLLIASFIAESGRRGWQSFGSNPGLAALGIGVVAVTIVAAIDGVRAYREEA
jgi:hypothetical protein